MQKFLDALASSGGHLLMLILAIAMFGFMSKHGIPKAEDMLEQSFAAFITLMVPGAISAARSAITPANPQITVQQ